MRYAKYILTCLLVVLSLLLTMELYKSYSADFDEYDYFQMEFTDATLEYQLERIAYLMDQNELDYFIVNSIAQDSSKVKIELYCSSDQVKQKLLEEDRRGEGLYKSLFYGSTEISYAGAFFDFADVVHTSDTVRVCLADPVSDIGALTYGSEYFAEDLIRGDGAVSYLMLIKLIWVVTAAFILLMSAMDSYTYQKTLFIQLTYGYERKVLILKRLGVEAAGLALAFLVPMLALHSYLIVNILTAGWWISAIIALAIDGLILLYPFWNFNCKAALGRGLHADRILTVCYGIRVVLLVISILLSAVAVRQLGVYMKCRSLNEVVQKYDGYADVQADRIDAALGAWSVDEDQMMLLRADSAISIENEESCEIIVANVHAAELLEEIIPAITEIGGERLIIFFPDNMKPEDLEEHSMEWLMGSAATFDEEAEIEYASYSAGVTLSYLGIHTETDNCTAINDDLAVCYTDDPIVIYYTGASLGGYYQFGFVPMPSEGAGTFSSCIDLYESYQESLNLYRVQCLMWGCIVILFLILLCLLRVVLLKLEHSLNAMELCLKKIYGMPLTARYDRMAFGTILSYVFGIVCAAVMLKKMGGVPWWSVLLTALVLFVGEAAMTFLEIRRWEKTHVMKILKGGCL